jgi:hypothetical protein
MSSYETTNDMVRNQDDPHLTRSGQVFSRTCRPICRQRREDGIFSLHFDLRWSTATATLIDSALDTVTRTLLWPPPRNSALTPARAAPEH